MEYGLATIAKRNFLIFCLAVILYLLLQQLLVRPYETSATGAPDITISCSAGCVNGETQ
jgi:hypothetical protein